MEYSEEQVYKILERVTDPEIPVLTVLDLGIIRKVEKIEGKWQITITPTYSACPAMNVIAMNIRMEMAAEGFQNVNIKEVLSPAWTTDWMTESGKQKLKAYGIAPPAEGTINTGRLFAEAKPVECPQCGSKATEMVSQFGSTACKAMFKCLDCLEPFDYFKCH